MLSQYRRAFPCDACGECCRNVHISVETKHLDRGDGTCVHFNDFNKLCDIYDDRPLVCRVQEYYDKNLSKDYEWELFIEMNIEICERLKSQKSYGLNNQ
ncbi:YkgJ family cysteine cluster protein [Vibrio artabrorum]|uniref:YkgJ family cysteine cluster protein n=1 Tax=Vibrio artabrorum TaxID=446374 RepID=UPI00354F2221